MVIKHTRRNLLKYAAITPFVPKLDLLSCIKLDGPFIEFLKNIKLFDYYTCQLRLAEELEKPNWLYFAKFRMGGFSTLMQLYGIYESFVNEKKVAFINKNYKQGEYQRLLFGSLIYESDFLYDLVKNNTSFKDNVAYQNSQHKKSCYYKPLAGKNNGYITYCDLSTLGNEDIIIAEEVAYDWHQPELSSLVYNTKAFPDRKVIIYSTLNHPRDAFSRMYKRVKDGKTPFKLFETSYLECERFKQNNNFDKMTKYSIGNKCFAKEYSCKFI